nr:MAG TPA: hypothetical protein [Bacteriophage sp.]
MNNARSAKERAEVARRASYREFLGSWLFFAYNSKF